MSKFAHPNKALIDALVAAGVIDDPVMIRRVLIDIQVNQPPMVYVEKFGDANAVAVAVAAGFGPGNLVPPVREVERNEEEATP